MFVGSFKSCFANFAREARRRSVGASECASVGVSIVWARMKSSVTSVDLKVVVIFSCVELGGSCRIGIVGWVSIEIFLTSLFVLMKRNRCSSVVS